MTNWENTKQKLMNWNILSIDDVPNNVIDYLKNNISNVKHNQTLAGHIKEEYVYKNWPNFVNEFILNKSMDPLLTDFIKNQTMLSSDKPFYLQSLWINLQKKYEFNPIHHHTGVFSFIIFLNIPYNLKDEEKVFPNSSSGPLSSKLSFLVTNYLGEIIDLTVSVDKSFEGKMLMFPSKMNHLVYPFYTSNKKRITVSGNISFWVD